MQYMLDADHCIYLMKQRAGLTPKAAISDCVISLVVYGELRFGIEKSSADNRTMNERVLLDFLSSISVVQPTLEVARAYGELRAFLKRTVIGPNDLWVAAHALAFDLPLVTNNTREFSRVPNLVIDTWIH